MSDEKNMYAELIIMFVVFCIMLALGSRQAEHGVLSQLHIFLLLLAIVIYLGSSGRAIAGAFSARENPILLKML
jgi:glycerol uptake facilitator-like aquaporin